MVGGLVSYKNGFLENIHKSQPAGILTAKRKIFQTFLTAQTG
jgi:hypothetical protein